MFCHSSRSQSSSEAVLSALAGQNSRLASFTKKSYHPLQISHKYQPLDVVVVFFAYFSSLFSIVSRFHFVYTYFFCHCRRHFVALVKISDDLKQRPRCESLALSFFLWFPTEWNCWFFHVRDFKSQLRFLCALVSASKIIECLLSAWHDTDLWLGRVARVRVRQQCAKQRQEKRN